MWEGKEEEARWNCTRITSFGEGGEMELLCESTEIWARHINGLHEPVQPISNWANFITRRRRTREGSSSLVLVTSLENKKKNNALD